MGHEFVNVSDLIRFTVTVTNNGPSNATSILVGEILDKHLKLISNVTTVGTYDGFTWNIPELNNQSNATLTIIAQVIAVGNITNAVTVDCYQNDTNESNNKANITNITALPVVDLTVLKEVNVTGGLVNFTDKIKFTITVHNNGPCNATGVNVTEVLNSNLKMISNETDYGHYSVDDGVWYIGDLANQSTAVLTIVARVVSTGNITNVVIVESNENDTNKSNNNDTIDNITALPIVDLAITKDVNVTNGVVNVSDKIK